MSQYTFLMQLFRPLAYRTAAQPASPPAQQASPPPLPASPPTMPASPPPLPASPPTMPASPPPLPASPPTMPASPPPLPASSSAEPTSPFAQPAAPSLKRQRAKARAVSSLDLGPVHARYGQVLRLVREGRGIRAACDASVPRVGYQTLKDSS